MDDVIFAGTEKRPALGRAEVGLYPRQLVRHAPGRVQRGHDHPHPVPLRGDSEYMINGAPCRLLDIQELLSDAGVGRQQHVIVSQGQIDAVPNARPEDRRGIIEEAAGVLKYRRRKEKAERRLDATEANLLRLQDLLREVRVASCGRSSDRPRRPDATARSSSSSAPCACSWPAARSPDCARSSNRSPPTDSTPADSKANSSPSWPVSTPTSCRSRPSSPLAARAMSPTA
ncbi:MAG: hypothetical protein R2697_04160 [Ilumatobacteraceae bacterium]